METIIYQGQEIQATRVNYISGAITTSTVDHEGDEDLFRDKAGRYYLRRQLSRLDSEGECRPASGRTLVHRINVNAAILWATTRLNSETLDLRADAAALLMEGRGYIDRNPSHLTTKQRAELANIGAGQGKPPLASPAINVVRHYADGSMAVTLHLKPEPARFVRAACEIDGCSPTTELYDGLRNEVRSALESNRSRDEEIIAAFKDNKPDEEEADERTVVNLRHTDGRLYARVPLEPDLEAMLEEKAREEGTDIGTALLNCLRRQCSLESPEQQAEANTYGVSLSTLEAAARYAATAGRTVDEMIVEWLELAATQDPGEQTQATATIQAAPALADLGDNQGLLRLDPSSRADIQEYSRTQNVSLDEALNKLVLAGVCAKGLEGKTVCLDWEPGEALELAKQYQAESGHEIEHIVNAAVEYALGMIFKNRADSETWDGFAQRVATKATQTFPLIGEPRESVPAAQVSAERYAANLGAVLAFVRATIDEIDPDPANLDVQDAAEPHRYLHILLYQALERFSLLFEVEVNGSMKLPVTAGRAVKSPATVGLDERALALVQRHGEDWGNKVADVVNGTLHFCLEAEEPTREGTTLSDSIDAIAGRRLGLDNWIMEGKPVPASRGRRRAKPNPTDVALVAAAAPEVVEPAPPPAEDDEHLPEEEHIDEPGDGTATPDGKEAQ